MGTLITLLAVAFVIVLFLAYKIGYKRGYIEGARLRSHY